MKAVTSGERLVAYLDMKTSLPIRGGLQLDSVTGEVEFRDVFFKNPSRLEQVVLDKFSLRLAPGKVTAVCGLSGAGKSTLADL